MKSERQRLSGGGKGTSAYSFPVQGMGGKRMAETPMKAEDIREVDVLVLSNIGIVMWNLAKCRINRKRTQCLDTGQRNLSVY